MYGRARQRSDNVASLASTWKRIPLSIGYILSSIYICDVYQYNIAKCTLGVEQ
jgi:hypothetical protein